MTTSLRFSPAAALLAMAATVACAGADDSLEPGDGDYVKGGALGKADASVEAIFVDFEFDGEVFSNSSFNAAGKIEDQLLYTIGHLNWDNSVGRIDQLQLSNIDVTSAPGGFRITYHAQLPVAWGKRNSVPQTYDLVLPADISFSGQNEFTENYSHDCVDFGAHDVTSGSMWYYYRPERSSCNIDDADVVELTADVSISDINTSGKYPEYDKVWEDDVLQVTAIFGKYEDGATSNGDAGISAYNGFTRAIKQQLSQLDLTTEPANTPFSPGVDMPEIVYSAALPDGKAVEVTAILVDNVRTAGAGFNNRYSELSARSDLIVYNGHAGLGANIRALAQKGNWVTGQYAIVFMNGCDTYAYVDSALNDAHSAVNPDDPNGTKYVDIVTNAMPSFFREMSGATMALIRGLMNTEDPQTYEQMFVNIDSDEVVLVSGEQDNVFVPGGGGGGGDVDNNWQGMDADGTVGRNQEDRFETPRLGAGRYMFELAGDNDADLYVRTGAAPTTSSFECRPFKTGSDETCVVELNSPATIHVMVRGWATSSGYVLSGTKL